MVEIGIMAESAARREWLLRVLEDARTIRVIGTVTTFPALRSLISKDPTDLVLIDLQSSSESRVVREWIFDLLDIVTLVLLSADADPAILNRLRHAKAGGILQANPSSQQILHTIHAVANGLMIFDSALMQNSPDMNTVEELTSRELDVLRLLAEGSGNREIALRLNISEHTIKFHISSILGKLGASSRTEAVSRGLRAGLIDL